MLETDVIQFILFVVTFGSILSIIYVSYFSISTTSKIMTRAITIYTIITLLYALLKFKMEYSNIDIIKGATITTISVFMIYCIWLLIDYIRTLNISKTSDIIKLLTIFVGAVLVLYYANIL